MVFEDLLQRVMGRVVYIPGWLFVVVFKGAQSRPMEALAAQQGQTPDVGPALLGRLAFVSDIL